MPTVMTMNYNIMNIFGLFGLSRHGSKDQFLIFYIRTVFSSKKMSFKLLIGNFNQIDLQRFKFDNLKVIDYNVLDLFSQSQS